MRTWLVIPAVACASAALGHDPVAAIALAAVGAAVAGAVRALAGVTLAAAFAAGAAGLLAALALTAAGPRAALACAAAMFALSELVRVMPPEASPLPAIGAAILAAVLDPAAVALVVIAGVRWLRGPWPRPRAAPIVPIVGVVACVVAIISAVEHAHLWQLWTAAAPRALPIERCAEQLGDTLGPLAAVAALAGLGLAIAHARWAAAAVIALAAGAIGVAWHDGAVAPSLLALAAFACGVANARIAALVRLPAGQACTGALAGFLVLAAPVIAAIRL